MVALFVQWKDCQFNTNCCCFSVLTLNVSQQALTNGACLMNIMHRHSPTRYCCQHDVHNLNVNFIVKKLKCLTLLKCVAISKFFIQSWMPDETLIVFYPDHLLCMPERALSLLWRYCFSQTPSLYNVLPRKWNVFTRLPSVRLMVESINLPFQILKKSKDKKDPWLVVQLPCSLNTLPL